MAWPSITTGWRGTGDDYGWPSNKWYDQPQTWQEVQLQGLSNCAGKSDIAYVYKYNTAAANDFKALLTSVGFGVDLIPQSAVTATNFTTYTAIIVADDTGSLNDWGAGLEPGVADHAARASRCWAWAKAAMRSSVRRDHRSGGRMAGMAPRSSSRIQCRCRPRYYTTPTDLSGLLGSPIKLYQALVNEVGIYVPGAPPAGVTVLGWELPSSPNGAPDHAPLIQRRLLSTVGLQRKSHAHDAGRQAAVRQCGVLRPRPSQCPRRTPPPNCITLTKTAVPPSGTTVTPGTAITYTLTYTVANNAPCATVRSELIDQVPNYSLFVPGSADRCASRPTLPAR